jgi:hypothetical protein
VKDPLWNLFDIFPENRYYGAAGMNRFRFFIQRQGARNGHQPWLEARLGDCHHPLRPENLRSIVTMQQKEKKVQMVFCNALISLVGHAEIEPAIY